MDRPSLILQTVWFHDSEQPEASRLGQDLYEQLTRPANEPLAFGAGIPVLSAVAWERVDLEAAEIMVVIPVLGGTSFLSKRQKVLAQLTEWHRSLGDGHVLIVPTALVWRSDEVKLPVKQFLTELYGKDDARRKTLDEIVLAVTRLLEPSRKNVRLFVSHAKADLAASNDAAKQVHDHIVTETTGHAFFDAVSLEAGTSLADQLDKAVDHGVFLAIRGDAYSSRTWCQRELLTAKRHELPSLTVEVLHKGEQRSSPYGGNGPSVVWDGNPAAIVSRAMIEWLRAAYFRKEARRFITAAGLPSDTLVLARPPELLDLAQGSLMSIHATLAMHPDPELTVFERRILKAAHPRLQLVTPTTAFRRLLNREGAVSRLTSPLQGLQVAMSLSDSADVNVEGFTVQHVIDATVFLARSLISAGAAIAYGGNFRRDGYTLLLADLIQGYNQTAVEPADLLHSYLGAPLKLQDAPTDVPLTVHHLVEETEAQPDVRLDAIMPPPSDKERHHDALYYSDMRQVMAKHTFARIVLGGTAVPRLETSPGYGGRLSGVVEEAWRTLEVGKPLYVVGGFGGAAALVADLLEGGPIPDRLYDKTWLTDATFQKTANEIDADPCSTKLGLPKRMEDLASAVMELAKPCLATDASALKWNGLTMAENRRLLRTRDPVVIASLVLNGLLNVAQEQGTGKLQIELVEGSVTTGGNLDAVAVATFDGIPLGGAGAALDEAVGGRATAERAAGRKLISLASPEIDADWLYLASLGALENVDGRKLKPCIEQAARETAHQAQRHGFQRLGVVTFGGAVLADLEGMAEAMLRGFDELRGRTTLVWCETNRERFDRLNRLLAGKQDVQLTTRRIDVASVALPAREEELILQVSLQNDVLTVTTLPPAGSAIASSERINLTATQIAAFTVGSVFNKRATPDLDELAVRGARLAAMLLGTGANQILMRCRDARIMIIHDVESSKLPFEMLTTPDGSGRPAVQKGISRRLAVNGVSSERLFARPPKTGLLDVLLIVNPTEDLPGTETEAKSVKSILDQHQAVVKLTVLKGKEATTKAVQTALAQADVLHYCGHAFFNGPGRDESGLILAGRVPLTLADLEKIPSLPRVAFVNACEAGRVRGSTTTEAAAFAELFLRSGVEAYLGTYWEVGDTAAASFATGVYTRLAEGQTLESAVTKSRAELLKAHEPDWANYILYGDGRFKLVVG